MTPKESHGCTCQACGCLYKVDLVVPQDLWSAIQPEGKSAGAGLLCGPCIMERIERLGKFGAYELVAPRINR